MRQSRGTAAGRPARLTVRRPGFSPAELLVAIGIVVLLLPLLFPALAADQDMAGAVRVVEPLRESGRDRCGEGRTPMPAVEARQGPPPLGGHAGDGRHAALLCNGIYD